MDRNIRSLRQLIRDRLGTKSNRPTLFPALLGNNNHVVVPPGRPDDVYYRTSDGRVGIALNAGRVAPFENLSVWIGRDELSSSSPEVLSRRSTSHYTGGGGEGGLFGTIPKHGETHRWLGTLSSQDTVFIELRQFMPFRITPAGNLTFFVHRGVFWNGTNWVAHEESDVIDLSGNLPHFGEARYVLVTLKIDGTIIITGGAAVDFEDLTLSDIPEAPADTAYILGAIRLYGGQTTIQENRLDTDIIDCRFPISGGVEGGGGSGDVATDDIWVALGDLVVGTGENTAAILPVGEVGQYLTPDPEEPTGLSWADLVAALLNFENEGYFKVKGAVTSLQDSGDDNSIAICASSAEEQLVDNYIMFLHPANVMTQNRYVMFPDGNFFFLNGGSLDLGNYTLSIAADFSVPANAEGFLSNDGAGNLAWEAILDGLTQAPTFSITIGGALAVNTDVGALIIPAGATIVAVYIRCRDPGTSGSTIVDIHKNGSTIFTTQANRPTLAFDDDDQVAKSGAPNEIAVAEYDILSIDIDEVAVGAADLTVVFSMIFAGTVITEIYPSGIATDPIWGAKGDVALGTGAATAVVLPVGADGQLPFADSDELTGWKWDYPQYLATQKIYAYDNFV